MNYKALRDLVLVKKIVNQTSSSGIILPETASNGRFLKLEVLSVGEDVRLPIVVGDIVLAEDMFEEIDSKDKSIGLIVSKYIVVKEDGKRSN